MRTRSDSYPGSFCIRYASARPSGENAGPPSHAGLSVSLFGAASASVGASTATDQRSALVEDASSLSRLEANTSSFPSGENA